MSRSPMTTWATCWWRRAICPRASSESFRDSLTIAERLADADPNNAGWQRDVSVSYVKVGDVLVAQGNLPEALKSFRDSLAITERLANADPNNAEWQRDVSVSYNKVGDVLRVQGSLPEALKSYPCQLHDQRGLTEVDPDNAGWQRDLSVSYDKVGDVLVAQGNLPEALKSFRDSLAIASASPRPTPAMPDGSAISRSPMTAGRCAGGAGQPARGAQSLSATASRSAERLAKADPSNAGWQRDLSVSYESVGDVLVAQGNLPEALKSYPRQPRHP